MQQLIRKITMYIFILRPVIDLLWDKTIVAGMNIAGIVSAVLVICMVLYLLLNERTNLYNLQPQYLFGVYATIRMGLYAVVNQNYEDLQNCIRILSALSILLIVVPKLNEKEFEFMIKGLIICTIIPIVISYLQVLGFVEYTYWDYIDGMRITRASGGYRQPSHLTRYLIFGIMYTLYFIYDKSTRKKSKKWFLLYLLAAIISIVFSYHRTGYLCGVILMLIYVHFRYKKNVLKVMGITSGATVMVLIAFIILNKRGALLLDLSSFQKFLGIQNIVSVNSGGVEKLNLRGRGNIISFACDNITSSPLWISLFGVGGINNKYTNASLRVADMDVLAIIWYCGFIGIILWWRGISVFINNYNKSKNYSVSERYRMLVHMSIVVYIVFGFTIEANFTPNFMINIFLINGFLAKKVSVKDN